MTTQFDYGCSQLAATETDFTPMATITAPIGASRITGICAEVAQETGYATMGFLGIAKLAFTGSEELEGIPVNSVASVDDGQVFYKPKFIPVNIPVVGGLTPIVPSIKLTSLQTGATQHGKVCLRFE
ncbi:hypothetical protein ES705_27034 [subsurface metagenome]